MTEPELLNLLLSEFAEWSKTCGTPIPPARKEILITWLTTEMGRIENHARIYPAVISRHLYQWFPVNMGYGLEDILEFARFLQDELEIA